MNANPIKKIHNNDRILNTLGKRAGASECLGKFIDLMAVRLPPRLAPRDVAPADSFRLSISAKEIFVPIISQSALTPPATWRGRERER